MYTLPAADPAPLPAGSAVFAGEDARKAPAVDIGPPKGRDGGLEDSRLMATPTPPPHSDPFFAPPDPGTEIHVAQWVDVVKRRRWVLIATWAAVLAVFMAQYARTPKAYESDIVIQIERRTSVPVKLEDIAGLDSFWDAQSFYPTQYELLQSRGLAERVVRDLKLADDPIFNPGGVKGKAGGVAAASGSSDAATVALAGKLLANLTIQAVRNTRMVRISYSAPTPELAARVANGVADAYIRWGIETRVASMVKASEFLSAQIATVKAEMQKAQDRLQAFGQRTDTFALDVVSATALQRWEELQKEYMAAAADRMGKEAMYRALSTGESASSSEGGASAPTAPQPQAAGARSPAEAKEQYASALRREQDLQRQADRVKTEVMRLSSAAIEYNNLKMEISTRQGLLDDLLKKQGTLDLAGGMRSESNVTVVDTALPPERPYKPSFMRSVALGLAIGLGLGIGLVVLVEVLDRTIRSAADAQRILTLPILGSVPDVTQAGRRYGYYSNYGYGHSRAEGPEKHDRIREQIAIELVSVSNPRHTAAEAYRSLRTSVLLSSAGGLKVVLVTSPVAGEGKTASAGNLAAVLAQLGKKVLLVDADLRKPHQHEVFKVSNRVGLVSVLVGQASMDEAYFATAVPELSVMPSGPIPPNPAELLASERMRDFVAMAKDRFDFVVLDSPPVLPVTDATILSEHVDGVVLCLGAGIVMRDEARHCRERLELAGAKVLGLLVNRVDESGRGYKRRYYHRYRSYHEDAAAAAAGADPKS
jgi:polysaccharide biosynthesis transport protein